MKKIIKSFDGTRINYNIKKINNKVIILLHGLGGNSTSMKPIAKILNKNNYSTITTDFRGHGLSEKPNTFEDYELHKFAKDIYEIIKKEKITDFVLVGHCFGAAIISEFHKLYPNLSKNYIFINSYPSCPKLFKTIFKIPFKNTLIKYYNKKNYTFELKQTNYLKLNKNNDLNFKRFYFDIKNTSLKSCFFIISVFSFFDNTKIFKTINQKSLIIHGQKDTFINKKYAIQLNKLIKNSELKIIPNTNHVIVLEKPELISDLIIKFLRNSEKLNC